MLVKDEADVIASTIRNLLFQVDEIFVADNCSSDGTYEILREMRGPIRLSSDHDPAYWQSKKTTQLAMQALDAGHSWVIPCDADEMWYVAALPERPIREFLAGLAPDVHVVKAELYNHVPTRPDAIRADQVFEMIPWRKRERSPLPKVACRLHDSLVIEAGNHSARYSGPALAGGGLCVRHFSWRSPAQYVRKIRNGIAAYAMTDLDPSIGEHWRMWDRIYFDHDLEEIADVGRELAPDKIVRDHFNQWFYARRPEADESLIHDPAPVRY
jgi:glycosyltransferase involved in cell wall biosynthesis